MNIKKSTLLIICSFVLSTMLTGCIEQKEIDEMIFVRAFALDKSDKSDEMRITTASEAESISTSGGKGETKKRQRIIYSEGKTSLDADRSFSIFTDKEIFWGHAKYIILGETAARDDVLKYLDFFIRNHESRLNTSIAVIRGANGSELLESSGDTPVYNVLSGIYSNTGKLSVSKEILLSEFIEKLNNKYSSVYLPCFHITGNSKAEGSDNSKKDIALDGYAVFKGTKLLEFITDKKARGLNWINGDVKSGVLVIKDSQGNNISLEIIDTNVKTDTSINNFIPSITIKVMATSNIDELPGKLDVFDKESISQLEKQQTDIIKDEVESIINFAQQNNVDILGFGDKVFHEHPVKWESIKDSWNTLFPKINVKVEVESKINRVYNIQTAYTVLGGKKEW